MASDEGIGSQAEVSGDNVASLLAGDDPVKTAPSDFEKYASLRKSSVCSETLRQLRGDEKCFLEARYAHSAESHQGFRAPAGIPFSLQA